MHQLAYDLATLPWFWPTALVMFWAAMLGVATMWLEVAT